MFLVFLYRVGDRRCHSPAWHTGEDWLQRCNGHIYLKMELQAVRGAGQGWSKSKGAVSHSQAEHSRQKTTPIDPPIGDRRCHPSAWHTGED